MRTHWQSEPTIRQRSVHQRPTVRPWKAASAPPSSWPKTTRRRQSCSWSKTRSYTTRRMWLLAPSHSRTRARQASKRSSMQARRPITTLHVGPISTLELQKPPWNSATKSTSRNFCPKFHKNCASSTHCQSRETLWWRYPLSRMSISRSRF